VSALAQSLHLEWSAPAGCPGPSAVLEQVKDLEVDADRSRQLSARGVVRERDQGGFSVLVETKGDGAGSRTIEVDSCAQAVEAAALVLSLALEKEQLARAAEQSLPLQLAASTFGTSGVGPLPAPSLGVGVALALQLDRARLELALSRSWARDFALSSNPSVTGTLDVPWQADLSLCWAFWRDVVELGACGGGGYGSLRGHGSGVSNPSAASTPIVEALAGLRADLHLWGPIWTLLDTSLVVLVSRPHFVFDGLGTLYDVPSVGARARLGIEVRGP
jgi:hypothetical protein